MEKSWNFVFSFEWEPCVCVHVYFSNIITTCIFIDVFINASVFMQVYLDRKFSGQFFSVES